MLWGTILNKTNILCTHKKILSAISICKVLLLIQNKEYYCFWLKSDLTSIQHHLISIIITFSCIEKAFVRGDRPHTKALSPPHSTSAAPALLCRISCGAGHVSRVVDNNAQHKHRQRRRCLCCATCRDISFVTVEDLSFMELSFQSVYSYVSSAIVCWDVLKLCSRDVETWSCKCRKLFAFQTNIRFFPHR